MQLETNRLFNFLQNFNQSPALVLAHRANFHDFNGVANAALVVIVMRHEFGSFLNELTIHWVLHLTLNVYGDSFIHFVAGYNTSSGFS
jgi:hypothetical protein